MFIISVINPFQYLQHLTHYRVLAAAIFKVFLKYLPSLQQIPDYDKSESRCGDDEKIQLAGDIELLQKDCAYH